MKTLQKTLAAVAALALLLPGAAVAKKGEGHAKPAKPEVAAKAKGKAGAPGQVCKGMKIKGKKTAAQRSARRLCIEAAQAARDAARTPAPEGDDAAPATVTPAP